MKNRTEIIDIIFKSLAINKTLLQKQFLQNSPTIGFFYVDNLLPKELAQTIYKCFPDVHNTVQRKSLKELKYTAYQMDLYDSLLEDVIYAFQDDKIVKIVSEICGIKEVYPDKNLYAGGLSLMAKNNFLNPHLDNSHDKDRNRWRVLNLLYYVTPDWKEEYGGNLEVWPNGLKQPQTTIKSAFNRLVVMATHQNSWHSVSKVKVDKVRCCISNYYFSDTPLLVSDTFHVTTFRAWPKEKLKDVVLQIDNKIRSTIRFFFKKGIRENPHQYKK